MTPSPLKPLNKADLADINETLHWIQHARELLQKCERCGFNVDDQRGALDYVENSLASMRQEFFTPEERTPGL